MKPGIYSIKDLETLSGTKAHTIRIWEKRYNLLVPERTETNIRLYDDDDLRRILNVSLLVNNGYKISKVAKWDETRIKETVLQVTESKTSEQGFVERLLLIMLDFNNRDIYKLIDEIILKLGLEEAVTKVFFVLFQRVGMFWQVGSIFPAQEHYLTNIFRQKLIAEIDRLEISNRRNLTMLFFLPENEMHEMSLLFYSYLAKKLGYNVVYLGQFVPFNDILKVRDQAKIDYVFTAFINAYPKDALQSYLENLNDAFPQQKIFITGSQLHLLNPEIPQNVKIVKDYHEFKKYLA